MSNTMIRVDNLSKKYVIGHQRQERYSALRDVLTRGTNNLGRKLLSQFTAHYSPFACSQEEFFALNDVSFEVKRGDRVGIIGRNGAGKSTLLKILSRIIEPSGGRVEITGRVASLLEVGTGFHPELTGRENMFLNGSILGMSKAEVRRKFDEIVNFAELEKFLDTPVKRYSSGMYVRLAFAVAAHLAPEILVVDEVLAVGDAQFQKKCMGKMEEVGKEGRTVMFVSHNMTAITNLCNKGMLLDNGNMIHAGSPGEVVGRYLSKSDHTDKKDLKWCRQDKVYPYEDIVKINGYKIVNREEQVAGGHLFGAGRYSIKVSIELLRPDTNIRIGFVIYSNDRTKILLSSANDAGGMEFSEMRSGHHILTTTFPISLLGDGDYYIEIISLVENAGWILPVDNDSRARFTVVRDDSLNPNLVHRMGGVSAPISPVLKWKSIIESGDANTFNELNA